MQVIEPGALPPALQIPLAEIVGLQFGLATSKEFVRIFEVLTLGCEERCLISGLVCVRVCLETAYEG